MMLFPLIGMSKRDEPFSACLEVRCFRLLLALDLVVTDGEQIDRDQHWSAHTRRGSHRFDR